MKNTWKIGALLLACAQMPAWAAEKVYTLLSPDKQIKVEITTGGEDLTYSVSFGDTPLLVNSRIGLDAEGLEFTAERASKKERKIDQTVESPFYRFPSFQEVANEMKLKLKGGWGVTFRAYDEGVAYRLYTDTKDSLTIAGETTEFNFAKDFTAYLPYSTNEKKPEAMAYQNYYTVSKLSEARKLLAFLPATVDCGTAKVTLMESDLEAYPGMFVEAEGTALKGYFAKYPKTTKIHPTRCQEMVTSTEDFIARTNGEREYPWRVLAITDDDREMPVNNLVYALASPNRIGDYSWVKPGKVSWEWWNAWNLKGVPFEAGINMDTYKYYIDFAAANKLEYIVLDEGWYNPKGGDMLTTIPELNLPELVKYGKSKGVDIVLWTVFNVLDDQLEEACKKYSEMGIKGFKVDFLDRDDQTGVEMAYRIAEKAAEYHLILDYHGIYKPTGMNRTYPNIINYESVFGMEEVKWTSPENDMPRYDVTFPFIRMMCGHVDYTPGAMRNASKRDFKPMYYRPMSMGTRCHQLATYIVLDSPFTMLCDAPTNYMEEPEYLEFLASIPVEVDDTRVLLGKLGEYIVTARRNADNWYVGGLTNWDARDLTIDFSFLGEGEHYTATIVRDGINADRQAEDYTMETMDVDRTTRLPLHLASGGGFAIKLIKK